MGKGNAKEAKEQLLIDELSVHIFDLQEYIKNENLNLIDNCRLKRFTHLMALNIEELNNSFVSQ